MRNRLLYISSLAVLLAAGAMPALAQQSTNASETASSNQPVNWHYYKLNFVLRETDEGKLVNQRAFTLGASLSSSRRGDSDRSSMRAGTRLPFQGEKGTEYLDLGTNLDAYRIMETPEGLEMFVTTEISSVAAEPVTKADQTPIRQVRANSSVLAPVGKATVVFTADDPVSKHRFALEVTPVRER